MSSFSFEFRSRVETNLLGTATRGVVKTPSFLKSPLLGEFFFVVGPMDYKEQFRYRISVEPTFGRKGNSVVGDFGIDNNMIELNGEFNILHSGRPDVVTPTIPLVTGSTGLKTGSMEFQDFLGLLYFVRYDNYIPQSIDTAVLASVFSINSFDHSKHILIFNDYDRGRRVEVVPSPEGIMISRSTKDNFCYLWNMKLIVISDESGGLIESVIRNPFNALGQFTNLVTSVINAPLAFTGVLVGLSGLANKLRDSISKLSNAYPLMKQQFNKDGQLIKNNFSGYKEKQNPLKEYVNALRQEFERQSAGSDVVDSVRGTQNNSDTSFVQTAQTASTQAAQINYQTGSILIIRPLGMSLEVYAIQPNATSISYITNNLYLSIITLMSSLNQITANMVIAGIDVNFYPYLCYAGETFESIALKQLGDKSLADALARYNNIKYVQAGSIIKIPFTRQLDIFAKVVPDGTAKTMEIALLGQDLKVTDNRDFAVDATGDLDFEQGLSCYLSNMIDLLETPINSLPLHEWWGNPVEIAEIPSEDLLKYYKQKLTQTIKADRRTQSVAFVGEFIEGDKFYIEIELTSIYNILPQKLTYSPSRSLL